MFYQASKLLDLMKNKTRSSKTKVISIASGKGGVGKSTITANLGYSLANLNAKVCLIDGDFGLANLHLHFNIKAPLTIYDYMKSTHSISDIKIRISENIDLFAGRSGIEAIEEGSIFVFIQMLNEIRALNVYDYILIDCGAGLDTNLQEVLKESDSLIGVTVRDPSALTDIYAFMKLASRFIDQINLIFNQTDDINQAIAITQQLDKLIARNIENKSFILNILGIISLNQSISNTARLKKLVVKEFSQSHVANEFKSLAKSIIKGK